MRKIASISPRIVPFGANLPNVYAKFAIRGVEEKTFVCKTKDDRFCAGNILTRHTGEGVRFSPKVGHNVRIMTNVEHFKIR